MIALQVRAGLMVQRFHLANRYFNRVPFRLKLPNSPPNRLGLESPPTAEVKNHHSEGRTVGGFSVWSASFLIEIRRTNRNSPSGAAFIEPPPMQ